jgi:hypothetical protein
MFVWCDVIPTMCQWRLLCCKPYMSPMIIVGSLVAKDLGEDVLRVALLTN